MVYRMYLGNQLTAPGTSAGTDAEVLAVLASQDPAAVKEDAGKQRCPVLRGSCTRPARAILDLCKMAQSSSQMLFACLQIPDELSASGAQSSATTCHFSMSTVAFATS